MKYDISKLTIEEKMKLLAGKNCWSTEDCNGKVYPVIVSDGPIGLRKAAQNEKGDWYDFPAIAYPSSEVLSQTWNPALAYKTGECLADDCIEGEVDVILGPGVNIKRSPLCGRNFEYFSEDPLVAGVFGREYINGVQSKHIGTSLKHYCANNSEFGRLYTGSEVDERTLREIYLEPFRIACEANPTTIMSSYNLVNGVRMSEHTKLNRILREELWNENGVIVSDWGAVHNHAASVKSGLDVEMPQSDKGYEVLKEAYEKGEVTEAEIDAGVRRVLLLAERCEADSKKRKITYTKEERRQASQKVAEEGIVLLKNEGVLPLVDGSAIIMAGMDVHSYYRGGGSSIVTPEATPKTLHACLTEALPKSKIDAYTVGGWSDRDFLQAFENGYEKDVSIVVCGDYESEGDDRSSMKLSAHDEQLILENAQRNPNTVVVIRYGSAVDMSAWADKVAAIVWAGYGGERGNEALADVLTGKVNPSGKLTETIAKSYEDYPVAHCYRDHAVNVYSEGLAVGYRHFDAHLDRVQYPFGFGLSYSKFDYSDLTVEEVDGEYQVKFFLHNDSKRAGAEVAQVYVHEVQPRVLRPYKELKGFDKVFLQAGEKKEVCIRLQKRAFAHYSVAKDCWTVTPGKFEILVGKSSQEICLKKSILLK